MSKSVHSAWRSVVLPTHEQPSIIAGMQQYYAERATEFDEWYLRLGKHVDPQSAAQWHVELAQLTEWVRSFGRRGNFLRWGNM